MYVIVCILIICTLLYFIKENRKLNAKLDNIYIHNKTGNEYTLLYITNQYATREDWIQQAVYVDKDGRIWSRPYNEFLLRYTMKQYTL